MGPAFDIGDIEEPPIGHAHYEQHGHVTGELHLGEQTIPFSGTGFRDHTWGPRNLGLLGRHVWLHGLFPSGRWFSISEVRTPKDDGAMIRFAYIGDADGLTNVRLLSEPALLDRDDDERNPIVMSVETDVGTTEIRGEIVSPFPFPGWGSTRWCSAPTAARTPATVTTRR